MARHSVAFSNRQQVRRVDKALRDLIRVCCKETLHMENVHFACELSVSFVSEQEIRQLNLDQRGLFEITDVLSFPLEEFEGGLPPGYRPPFVPLPLGDIVLCLRRAEQQAQEFGHSFERECGFLTVHSVLHLLGYDHLVPEQEAVMRQKQEQVLLDLGLTRPTYD